MGASEPTGEPTSEPPNQHTSLRFLARSPNPTRASSVINKSPSFDAELEGDMDIGDVALGEDLIEATIGQMRCLAALDKSEKVRKWQTAQQGKGRAQALTQMFGTTRRCW